MRQFAAKGLRIAHLGREAKVIYSFFCALSLLALFSSLLLYEDLVGPALARGHLLRVQAYYGKTAPTGSMSRAEAAEGAVLATAGSPAAGGPDIALPSDDPTSADPPAVESPAGRPQRLTITVPYRKLLEVTHFHLFTVPVFLLILTHLFLLCGLSPAAQLAWIVAGWMSASLHMATPWLLRVLSPRWTFLHAVSGLAFLLSALVLCLLPVVQMWRPVRSTRRDRHGGKKNRPSSRPAAEPHPLSAVELDSASASRVDSQ
ncbi:MAG: hypothetical protein JNJ46_21130 [Myxococcales bacterium]|nr:hypothetical protein [Myxococcales bacterium]